MTHTGMWVIGYGSLIFKPPPNCSFKVSGYLKGFVRRFWQSSSDHRGTPESPGRVVTLVSLQDLKSHSRFHASLQKYDLGPLGEQAGDLKEEIDQLTVDDLRVWGVAYYVEPEHVQDVRNYLDIREQDGYTLQSVPFHVTSSEEERFKDLTQVTKDPVSGGYQILSSVYIGTIDNESFVGPEDNEVTAQIIRHSVGPSGPNTEYLAALHDAVNALDTTSRDRYLDDLVGLVKSK